MAECVTAETLFDYALPVWPEGRGSVWNQFVGFHASWDQQGNQSAVLRATAADYYRAWCNGCFVAFGPARAAHGYARADEWCLDGYLQEGVNHLAVEVLAYGIDSYAHAMQPPFLQAEVVRGGEAAAATRAESRPDVFVARILPERIQKVERYSAQRPFAEAYRLKSGCHDWRIEGDADAGLPCELVARPTLLPRGVRYPRFDCLRPEAQVASGRVVARHPALNRCASRRATTSAKGDGSGTRSRSWSSTSSAACTRCPS